MVGLLAVQSAQTPLGFDAADVIAALAVIVSVGIALLTAIGVLMLRILSRMDSRIEQVSDDADAAVKDLRRDLSSDLRELWRAIRAPGIVPVGPPTALKENDETSP